MSQFGWMVDAAGGPVPPLFDYFAVIVGVVTGAMFGCERKLDIIGTTVCGLFTAYGGGILRDVLLQDEGFFFMQHPYLFLFCIGVCWFVFYFQGVFRNLPSTIFLCDTLSVALYAVAGASKAYASGAGAIMSVFLGAVVGVGGGSIRDSFVGEVPNIFKSTNFYAVAVLGGSFAYVACAKLDLPLGLCAIACVFVTLALRYLSVWFDWRTDDNPVDLSQHVRTTASAVVGELFVRSGAEETRKRNSSFGMTKEEEERLLIKPRPIGSLADEAEDGEEAGEPEAAAAANVAKLDGAPETPELAEPSESEASASV